MEEKLVVTYRIDARALVLYGAKRLLKNALQIDTNTIAQYTPVRTEIYTCMLYIQHTHNKQKKLIE